MLNNKGVIVAVMREHIRMQEFLKSDDPTVRRVGFEAMFVLDNRALGLLVSENPFVTPKDWFKMIEEETDSKK